MMFPGSLTLVVFFKLINTLVALVDLQQFRPEFCVFDSIMRHISVTKQPIMSLCMTPIVTHTKLFISLTVYVMDIILRLNLDQH